MSNVPTKKFTLPSLGRFYGDKLPGGEVQVRKMTINDLSVLEQGNVLGRIDEIIKRCTILPQGMGPSELLSSDRMALFFCIRVYSFSTMYAYEYKCPHCGTKNKKDCDLSADLKVTNPEEGMQEPVTLNLPDAEAEVAFRFIRGRDEEEIRIAKSRNSQVSEEILSLEKQLLSKDGAELTAAEKTVFIRGLTAADVVRIKNRLEAMESSISTLVTPTCAKCGEESEMSLPIGREFFRPTNL
jgi:hypothetical protein